MAKVWTYMYNAFTMGGNLNVPTGFEFDETTKKLHDLGEGYFGYELITPKGQTIVVESASGAIIGDSIESVQSDIVGAVLAGQQHLMKQQVINAMAEDVKIISEEEFWKKYNRWGVINGSFHWTR